MGNDITYFAVRNGAVIEVLHIKKRWWKNVETGEEMLISDRNIFKTRNDAEQSISARIRSKQVKEQRLDAEYLAEEQRRDQIFRENPWLLDIDGIPFGTMLSNELEDFIKFYKNGE